MSIKPIIGVMPLWDEKLESYWMIPGYLDAVTLAGGIPVTVPETDDPETIKQISEKCDGFLFTGGHDISPEIYGDTAKFDNVECCKKRDRSELLYLTEALCSDKPILGICRGLQLINAVLGGTLYQDLPNQLISDLNHHQSPPYDKPSHDVNIISGSPLEKLFKAGRISVNSYHHQGICNVSPEAAVMARADDGLAEAVCIPEKRFVWAVQWHPEFSYKSDKHSMALFSELVKHCADSHI